MCIGAFSSATSCSTPSTSAPATYSAPASNPSTYTPAETTEVNGTLASTSSWSIFA